MKNLKNLGSVLSKTEQKSINGGICKCGIKIPSQGRYADNDDPIMNNNRCCDRPNCPTCKSLDDRF